MGVRGQLLGILRSYPNFRTQHVAFDGGRSTSLTLHTGDPQGSLLGPILFLVFVNEVPSLLIPVKVLSFLLADDFEIIMNPNDLSDCFPVPESWAALNKMSFHPKKTKIVNFYGTEPCYVCDTDVEVVDSHRDLGLIVSSNLRLTEHISVRLAKAYNTFHQIKRNSSVKIGVKAKLDLCKSIVLSIIYYHPHVGLLTAET